MTALRQSAIRELEKIPEDKLTFVIQIMQGVNGLYSDTSNEKKEAFATLERLRKKGTVDNYNDELNTYRDEKADYEFSDIIAIEPKDFIKEICNAN